VVGISVAGHVRLAGFLMLQPLDAEAAAQCTAYKVFKRYFGECLKAAGITAIYVHCVGWAKAHLRRAHHLSTDRCRDWWARREVRAFVHPTSSR